MDHRLLAVALVVGASGPARAAPDLTDPAVFRPLGVRIVETKRRTVRELPKPAPPDLSALARIEKRFGALPSDYRKIFTTYLGGELRPGKKGVLVLDPLDDAALLADDNLVYGMSNVLPIASDGGEIVVFFDVRNQLGRGAFAVFSYERGTGPAKEWSCFEGPTLSALVDKLARGDELWMCKYPK